MAKIHIDAGHGYPDNRGGVDGLNEGENNFYLANDIGKGLTELGHEVTYSKTDIHQFTGNNENLTTRRNMGVGKDYFLSIHSNAVSNKQVSGVEIYDSYSAPNTLLAQRILEVNAKALGIQARGVRYRSDSSSWDITQTPVQGKIDYYGVLRGNKAKHAMLIEHFYHTHLNDVRKYRENRQALINAVVKEVDRDARARYGNSNINILAKSTTTIKAMQDYAKARNADPLFIELAPIFYSVSVRHGVDPAITYAQSGKETAFMKFGGVLDKSFKNPCGLKTTVGGGNYDKQAHKRFDTWEQGITAQVEHLALYAGHKESPFKNAVDPRHFPSIRGTAPTVRDLGGKWAPSGLYGDDILRRVRELWSFNEAEVSDTPKGGDKMTKGNMKSVITYLSHAEGFALKLSRELKIPMINSEVMFDYSGLDKVIGVGEDRYVASMTSYLTHFINAHDNWSKDRNDKFMTMAIGELDKFKRGK